jgi:DNA-binding protein HU-beta
MYPSLIIEVIFMNRDELVTAISEISGLPKSSVSKCLSAFVEVVKNAVGSGDKVTLVGFGTWYRSWREAREGRNPSTGEKMQIKGRWGAKFKAGRDFSEKVNEG